MKTIILVGGFLGAGKTTLLYQCAQRLTKQGVAVGLITNDQAPDLVDTLLLSDGGFMTKEVSGSCFCCNFHGFTAAVKSLADQGADIILAEPVGSCTDLISTIVQPLKKKFPEWNVAPLTVLTDSGLIPEILGLKPSNLDPDALYILNRQIQEADWVALSKTDILTSEQQAEYRQLLASRFPGKPLYLLSTKTPPSIDEWLAAVQNGSNAGKTRIEVDYDRYAHGEAVLAWLNCCAAVNAPVFNELDFSEEDVLVRLISELKERLQARKWPVGHIKAALYGKDQAAFANLTSADGPVSARSEANRSRLQYQLVLNARVQTAPENLEPLVRDTLTSILNKIEPRRSATELFSLKTMRCFQPGRPNPTFRTPEEEYK